MPGKVDPRVAPAVAAASYATQMAGHDEPRPRWPIIALLTYLYGVQLAAADRELVLLPEAAGWVAMLFATPTLFERTIVLFQTVSCLCVKLSASGLLSLIASIFADV